MIFRQSYLTIQDNFWKYNIFSHFYIKQDFHSLKPNKKKKLKFPQTLFHPVSYQNSTFVHRAANTLLTMSLQYVAQCKRVEWLNPPRNTYLPTVYHARRQLLLPVLQ